MAGTEIVQPVRGGQFGHQPVVDSDKVFDVDEVAALVAVGVFGVMAAEELHRAGLLDLVKGMPDHTGHAAFVVFVGAVNVEEFETVIMWWCGGLGQHPVVEVVFRAAVFVEWFQDFGEIVVVFVAVLTEAVSSPGAGVDQGCFLLGAALPDFLGIVEVQAAPVF